MALDVAQGTFAAATSTGNQEVNFSSGFTPKVVFFYGVQTTAAATFTALRSQWFGATDGTRSWCVAWASDDAAGSSNCGFASYSTPLVISSDGTPTVDGVASIVSLDADGFTINWSNAPTSAVIVHYLALGGSDLTNVRVDWTAWGTGAAGTTFAETGVGFQPDAVLLCSYSRTTVPGTYTISSWSPAFGAMDGTNQASTALAGRDAQASGVVNASYQRTDRSIMVLTNTASATPDAEASYSSFDSDGFTLSINDAAPSALALPYVAFQMTNVAVFNDTQKTSTGTKAKTGIGFTPKAGLFFSAPKTAGTTVITADPAGTFMVGAAAGSTPTYSAAVGVEDDAADPTITDSYHDTDEALIFASNTGGTNAVDAEASVSTWDSDGFTLDWGVADATAREFWGIVFGALPSSNVSVPSRPLMHMMIR